MSVRDYMKTMLLLASLILLALFLLFTNITAVAPTADAQTGGQPVRCIDLSFTSPAAESTVAQAPVVFGSYYHSMLVYAALTGATGGTLDIYIQVSPDQGYTWIDYAHFAQLAAADQTIYRALSFNDFAQQTTATAVGVGGTPAISGFLGGEFGDRFRVVAVAGADTSAGAVQTIKILLKN